MVEYIRGNIAGDSFTRSQDRNTRRRNDEYALNRQMGVDDATRRGLRRILASGTTAPAAASDPTGGVNLPGGSFDATAPQPTVPMPPQEDIQPTIAPTPVPAQTPTQAPALVSGAQPTGYDPLDSRLPGLGPSASAGSGQDELAGGAGYDLLAGVESGRRQMDPKTGGVITSHAGAQGVMQVMPTTGPEAAALAGIPWDEALYNDPGPAGEAYSIKLGDAYFEEMKRQFGGNVVLATAAYNAGPGRVRQSLRTGAPLPAETQAYLDKIFGPGAGGGQGATAPRGNGPVQRSDLRQMAAGRPSGMQQYGPILEELADAPGGGQAALQLLGNANARDQRIEGDQLELEQTFARDDSAMERVAMTALAHGDMDTFDYWAKKSGIQVPQQVLADKRQSSLFARGALLAEQFYKADQQQAVRFIQGYMQGGPQAGFAAAGAPINNQRVTLRDVQVGDQRLIARIGDSGQSLGYVTGPDGQPVQSATGARNGFGAGQDASVKRRDYEALVPQLGEALARATVYGQNGLNPGERYLRSWLEEAPKMGVEVNQETLAKAKETADLINQQLGAQVAVPASQSVTDPGVQAPEGFDVQQQDSRVWADGPDGSPYYTEDGGQTWFDESGSPYAPDAEIPGMLQ